MGEPDNREIFFRLAWSFKGKVQLLAARLIGERIRVEMQGHSVSLSMPDAETIQSLTSIPFDGALVDELERVGIHSEQLEQRYRERLSEIHGILRAAAERFLRVIKFYLDEVQVSETELRNMFRWEWSVTGNDWQFGPMRIRAGGCEVLSLPGYHGELTARVTAAVAGEDPPVLIHAMRHLHRAKREREPRHRWIDATIAAELGIKEFLAAYKPELESLLLEVPSPPLRKLYGAVLESYAGKRSPKLKEIANGGEKRNLLVHKPSIQEIGSEEADAYVKDVEIALLHLLTLLYPEDDLIRYRYDLLVGALA